MAEIKQNKIQTLDEKLNENMKWNEALKLLNGNEQKPNWKLKLK